LDHFEFILIITSVIFALAVAQILSGVSRIAQTKFAIRFSLPHSIWVINLFVFIFLVWWVSWEFRDIQWTFPRYAYMILAPTLLYFACSLVMPQRIDGPELNMDEHFFRIRRPLFISFALATLVVMVDGDVLKKEPLFHSGRIGNLAMLALAFLGYVSANKKMHNLIASLILLVSEGRIQPIAALCCDLVSTPQIVRFPH
jgi:anaerobic C4-dicarboxylate transporter